jgi:hypothetical protein
MKRCPIVSSRRCGTRRSERRDISPGIRDAAARFGTSNIAATRAPPPFAGAMIVIPTTGVAAMWAPLTGSGPVR